MRLGAVRIWQLDLAGGTESERRRRLSGLVTRASRNFGREQQRRSSRSVSAWERTHATSKPAPN
jgi:hypothetical protein